MKAIAVTPGRPDSIHLRDVPTPSLTDLPDGRGVLVKTLRVGVDGTDKEINAAEYGAPPAGDDYLIIGHESFGVVEAVGANVTQLQPGDYVVASVRRPGHSLYDQVGLQDMTTDDTYFERGINLRHGYLSEYFVEDVEYLIQIPERLKTVAVLTEPTSVTQRPSTRHTKYNAGFVCGGPGARPCWASVRWGCWQRCSFGYAGSRWWRWPARNRRS